MTAEDPRSNAGTLLQNAKDAMAEMTVQIAEAKQYLKNYVEGEHLDINDKADVDEARRRYQSSLTVTVLDNPDTPGALGLMQKMYGLYEKTFPIEEEREELDKLMAIMGKNHDKKLQASGAPFKEMWVIVQDKAGDVVAAANTITFSASKDKEVAKSAEGTTHLTYIFADPRYRSLGLGDFTLARAEVEARNFVASTYPGRDPKTVDLIQIAEQNAPLEMPMEAILVDTAGAKIDQFYRRKYFEGLSFRQVVHNYVQLPLEPGGEAGEGMNLIIRGLAGSASARGMKKIMDEVATPALRFHLYNFFDRAVAAGQYDIEAHPEWVRQASELESKTVKVKPSLDFMALAKPVWSYIEKYIGGKDFDADTFANGAIGELIGVKEIPPLANTTVADGPAQKRTLANG